MAGGDRLTAGHAGPPALQAREAAIERWLREDVAPACDAMRQDPSRAVPAERVLRNLRAHHAKRPTSWQGP
jgi:antitoxin ParD1/3/4